MTTPTDPIPEFRLGADRYARREPVAGREAPAAELDAETQEVVETFEALYAELSTSGPVAEPAVVAAPGADDDLLVDLPAGFEDAETAPRTAQSRPEPARELVAARPAPARALPTASETDPSLDIDDAFAMLRAAESKGRENAEREAVDREDAESAQAAAIVLTSTNRGSRRRETPAAYEPSAPAPDWTGKARTMWPRVAAAAVIALIVGTGLGYLVGRAPDPAGALAKIPVTPQGGARLQFDYELRKN